MALVDPVTASALSGVRITTAGQSIQAALSGVGTSIPTSAAAGTSIGNYGFTNAATAAEGVIARASANIPLGAAGRSAAVNITARASAAAVGETIIAGARIMTPIGMAMAAGGILSYLNQQGFFDIKNTADGLTAKKSFPGSYTQWIGFDSAGPFSSGAAALDYYKAGLVRSGYHLIPNTDYFRGADSNGNDLIGVNAEFAGSTSGFLWSIAPYGQRTSSIRDVTQAEIQQSIGSNPTNDPNLDQSLIDALKQAMQQPGNSLQMSPPTLTGPLVIPGPQIVTTSPTTPGGPMQTTTKNTEYRIRYDGDKMTVEQVETSTQTVVDPATGQPVIDPATGLPKTATTTTTKEATDYLLQCDKFPNTVGCADARYLQDILEAIRLNRPIPTTSPTTSPSTDPTTGTATVPRWQEVIDAINALRTSPNGSTTVGTATTTTSPNNNTATTPQTTTTTSNNTATTPQTDCDKKPNSAGCQDLDVPDGDQIPRTSRDVTYAPESYFGSGSCPSDKTLTLHSGQTLMVWNWQTSCSYITSFFRPILLTVCAFVALMIIAPGVKDA